MKKLVVEAKKRGKRPEPKIAVPEGWWDKVSNYCQANKGTKTNEAIYGLTTVSRRTFLNSQKTNEFTEKTFNILVEKLGLKNREALLDILGSNPIPMVASALEAKPEIEPQKIV